MPDYKSLYFSLYGKVASAIELLVEAQQEAENAYMEADNPPVALGAAEGD